MDFKTDEIVSILKKQLDTHNADIDISEVGEITYVGDGVARVSGLENVMSSELVELPNNVFGMALNLEEDSVGIVLFGDSSLVKEGDIAKRMYTDDVTPYAEEEFVDVDWKYEYDEYIKQDNSKFKSDSETKMQYVDIEINYDEIIDKTEENKKFINDTSDWKSIYDNKKY